MEGKPRVKKSEKVKIIQVISHCDGTMGGDYQYHMTLIGLGNDNKLYEHNRYENSWYELD